MMCKDHVKNFGQPCCMRRPTLKQRDTMICGDCARIKRGEKPHGRHRPEKPRKMYEVRRFKNWKNSESFQKYHDTRGENGRFKGGKKMPRPNFTTRDENGRFKA